MSAARRDRWVPDRCEHRTPNAEPRTSRAALTVRPATLADLETVVALRLALVREAHEHPLYRRLRPDATLRARRTFRQQLTSTTETTLLATSALGPVGILRCVESPGSPLLDPERYAYVASVYVVPRARRSGVLRALLASATAWCLERELDEMRLHCVAADAIANAAWDALGFSVVEHLRLRHIAAPARNPSPRTRRRAATR